MTGGVTSARGDNASLAPEAPEVGHKPDFCVVGIGASAGGLDALRAFFSRMPPEPGFACVIVMHLSPEHESHMVQLLQPYTRMQVCQVTQTVALERNRVYVIPPNANLNSIDTHLRLSQLEARRVERAPIDHFLRTLAETHGETAVGLILTGSGSDGALGIRQIKEHGGLTLAQHPGEAQFASMPQSAIATGSVDMVLSLRDMAEELVGYCRTLSPMDPGEANSLFEKILGELRLRTGQEFAAYRPEVVMRSVRRRMRLRHVPSLAAYFELMLTQTEEPGALHNDLLLHVTEFFRDADTFQTIELVLRDIIQRKSLHDGRVRVWSVGCASGEEAYSIAMLLVEGTTALTDPPQIQVFASELSRNNLQLAREGVYPQEIAASVSPDRLERFFVHETSRYRVRRELRDLVTFANHDLFKDPPYSHLDMIICRSLFRDLKPETQRGVLSLFYYALAPHGVLLTDEEGIDTLQLFTPEPSHPKLLRRVSGPRRNVALPADLKPFARLSGERLGTPIGAPSLDAGAIFRRAVEPYTPASVLIDVSENVVHFSVTAARYVRIPGGELTSNIRKLVPRAIRSPLAAGLNAMREGAAAWESEPFPVAAQGHMRAMVLRLVRTAESELILVVFDDAVEARNPHSEQESLEQVRDLGAGLAAMHRDLMALSGDASKGSASEGSASEGSASEGSASEGSASEGSASEGSASEGSASTFRENDLRSEGSRNAELHGVVDQLEAAREELQAVNEELISLNEENRHRVEALAQLSNDLQHLLESTGLATLIVDQEMKIRRFTPLAAELLRLRDPDVGRPLGDLRHRLHYPRFIEDVRRVVEEMADVESEIESDDGRWFLIRIQPYRSALRGMEGAAVVLFDITARKRAEMALRESDRRKDEFLAVLAHELRNPLAPIGAGIEVLRKLPATSPLGQQVVTTMARQTKQLVRLVDDLLEVGRISEGKLVLRLGPVRIAEVVHDAVAVVRPAIDNQNQTLAIDLVDPDLVVEGDAARLAQVLGNLLHNAARYTPAGGHIALKVTREDDQAVIRITDDGFGISAQALPYVFEMFYQGTESKKLASSGLGIGLTLAKRLVEMHSGTIAADSRGPNAGSTFTVRLPISSGREEKTPQADGDEESEGQAPDAAPRRGVLIVDDNIDAAETLKLLMEALGGNEVETASNGAQALEVGARLMPQVVLLDLSMPGMDGYELARHIRAQEWGRTALLVALTGWGQEQHRRRSKEAGFDRHLTKPANAESLRAVLNGR
jgi:two-component system, chemotaxis family, CheB/CheR fusion protein